MPIIAMLLAAFAQPHAMPPCRAAQLHLTADDHDGGFSGMSHSGTELTIRNSGAACRLPAVPRIAMRDARGRVVARGEAPDGAATPASLRLRPGARATILLRWVSNEVFDHNRTLHPRSVTVAVAGGSLRTPLHDVTLVGEAGDGFGFEQQPAELASGHP